MGNRAVITTERKDLGVYLHWNGGKDSVQAFLKYCELKGYASPEYDTYGWARLCQVIGNFFGGTNSVGISRYEESDRDNFDNGVYIIRNWQIVGREYFKGGEQLNYDLEDMLKGIDSCQPQKEQLGDFLKTKEVLVSELKIGDEVYIATHDGYEKHKVVGFGEDRVVNGRDVKGMPYVDLCLNKDTETGEDTYAWNPNNYIRTETIRVVQNEMECEKI